MNGLTIIKEKSMATFDRKIIQLTCSESTSEDMGDISKTLYALCDDQTMWLLQPTTIEKRWIKLPELPND